MDQKQVAQLRAQLKIAAQLNTCSTTNTKEIDCASGLSTDSPPETIFQANQMFSMTYWKNCPETPHHRYIHCPLSDFKNHQLPMALLAQERDNYIQMKMQTHLRRLKIVYKSGNMKKEEKEKLELMRHFLFLNSRQKYVRDNFYESYAAFSSGNPLKKKDISAIIRMPKMTKQEFKKCYVIRGISYNDFLWATGKDFTPETPFTPLPRYVIRDRQKNNPDVDLKQTLPVVKSVLSASASLIVASHAYEFFSSMRQRYQQSYLINHNLNDRWVAIEREKQMEKLQLLKDKVFSLSYADEEEFNKFWSNRPVFTHGIRIYPRPSNIDQSATLHRYQIEGFSWLVHLFDHHVNAIFADETGLGKTHQVIMFLAFLAEQRRISGPHLIIMPNSVLQTWKEEFQNWYPSANTILYIGKRKRRRNLFETIIARSEFDVLLTSYNIFEKDRDLILGIPFRVVVLDEASKLKNSKTALFSAVDSSLFSDFRILITATPFQNDIEELWSLLYLVSPNEFCSHEIFNSFFKELESSNQDEETTNRIIKRLHEILRPYILRRTKDEIGFDIPSKLEITIKCSPSELQKSIIEESLVKQLNINQKIVISRKVSNSPALFLQKNIFSSIPVDYLLLRSPKMRLLDKILHKLIVSQHRFLIYSQWTSMMDLIELLLHKRDIEFLRIDGSVSSNKRMMIINNFCKADSTAQGMLLSTRSSAFGLNLQVADTVILFDSDYNPFVELQASARVHRIGQKNVVVVIRLLMNGTGEEKILRVSRKKFILGHQIINAGKFNLEPNEDERDKILKEPVEQIPELIDPTNEQLDSVVARSNEELAALQWKKMYDQIEELPTYSEIDSRIISAATEDDVTIPSDESDNEEWEVIE